MKSKLTSGAIALLTLMTACGDVPTNSQAHGGIFGIESIEVENSDVDMVQSVCDPAGPTFETFIKDTAQVSFFNQRFTELGATPQDEPPYVILTDYTVEYVPLSNGPSLSPLELQMPSTFRIPGGGTAAIGGLELVPLSTKLQFMDKWADIAPANRNAYRYEVRYTFNAVDEFGVELQTTGAVTLTLSDFDTCGG